MNRFCFICKICGCWSDEGVLARQVCLKCADEGN